MLKKSGKTLFKKTVLRKNFFTRGFGLMLHKPIKDEAHIFIFSRPRKEIITMFMVFFRIDIVCLDKNKKIICIKEDLRPFTNYNPRIAFNYLIEMPSGSIKKFGIKKGEKLDF